MTREVRIGNVGIGGKNPVRIAGMLKVPNTSKSKLIKEAKELEKEGAEIIRVAFKEREDKQLFRLLKREISLPLVADVHFDEKLALLAIEAGFECIRLNPLNISKKKEVKIIIREAKRACVSIRVGINSGGFKKKFKSPLHLAKEMSRWISNYIKLFEEEGFFDMIVSLKASDVNTTLLANRIFAKGVDYPLELGITASGPYLEGIIKSSLGIGILLSAGIGNMIRVSLTYSSLHEVKTAKAILQFLGLRDFFPEIISCPTCGRCKVNLIKIVKEFKNRIERLDYNNIPKKIALMGCVVNGPGEAYQADIGAAFGSKKAVIFKKDKILGYSSEKNIIEDLFREFKAYGLKN